MSTSSQATPAHGASGDEDLDQSRRFLLVATSVAGGAATAAAAWPFLASMLPSERASAAGAPVEVDICDIEPGENDGRRVARQAGLGRAPHAGDARRR